MPFHSETLLPENTQFVIKVGDPVKIVNVPLTHDTVSLTCGTADGVSFCGSGEPENVHILFKDKNGIQVS